MAGVAGLIGRLRCQSKRSRGLLSAAQGTQKRSLAIDRDHELKYDQDSRSWSSDESEASTSAQQGPEEPNTKYGREWSPKAPVAAHAKDAVFPVKVTNFPRMVIRRDFIRLLEPLNVMEEDVRPAFDEHLRPMGFWINLPTEHFRHKALKYDGKWLGTKQVRIVPGSPGDMWREVHSRFAMSSRGRYVLVSGFRANESYEEVMKLFDGFSFLNHACNITRRDVPESVKTQKRLPSQDDESQGEALVRFSSDLEAQRAMRHCAQGFVGNRKIALRVLP